MTRVAIVGGARTPFVKAGSKFIKKSALELASATVNETISKVGVDANEIDELVYGSVLLNPRFPNFAREIVLRNDLPKSLSAHFISNNCITGLVAAEFVRSSIISGRISSGLAGGVESMSNPVLTMNKKAEKFYLGLNYSRTLSAKLKQLLKFRPGFILPQAPSPKEPSTGLTMGQHAEITAKEFEIERKWQDEIAYNSHMNSFKAQEAGYLSQEIVEIDSVKDDNVIRSSTSMEKLASLKPVFDRSEKGSITAGNASPLTDGASCVCLMSEEKAKSLNLEILGYIEAVEFSGLKPEDGLLMAPAIALSKLFEKNNLSVDTVDRFEIHEAFGAQVASNLKVWENGWDKYNIKPIGKIPTEKINVNGSSISIGHPFAATGGRLILSLVNELKRNNLKNGVISICAAGAMAGAALITRE